MSKVSIAGKLEPAEALVALFNAAKPQGLGKLQYNKGHSLNNEGGPNE